MRRVKVKVKLSGTETLRRGQKENRVESGEWKQKTASTSFITR